MTIRITGDGPKITATGSGSTVLVEISTGQHDPGSFSGVHNDLTGRSTSGAHVGTAVSIDPTGFAGNLDESITNAQLLAAAVDDLTTGGGGGGGGGASLSDATPQALGTAAAGTGTAAARDDHVHAMPTAADVGADADGAAQAVADSLGGAAVLDVGTTAGTVAAGDDARLSDARTPTSHDHAASEVTSGTLDIARIPTGTTSTTVPLGNDSRFTDARTPTAHKTSHATGGSDALTASDIGAAATSHTHTGTQVTVDASGFNGNLTTSDDTVQEVAQKLDDLVIPAAGIADPGGANDDFLQRKAGAWTYRTVAQVKTDLGIGTAPFVLNTPVGQYAGPSAPNTSISNQTDLYLSAGGRGSACLVYLAAGTYDRIGVWLQSAGAAIIRIGLYTAGTDGLPATRVLDAGTIDVSGSTGLREITISQTVTAGWYWASVSADSYTSTFSLYGLNPAYAPFIAGGVHYATGSIRQKVGVASNGFGTTGIPDPFPTLSWSPDGAPKVILRRSA